MSFIRSEKAELRRHELFEGIIEQVKRVLIEHCIDEDIGEQAGCAVVDYLCKDWAGLNMTFPVDYKYRVAQRDLDIYSYHRGDFSDTARKFKMTERGVRKVIDRVVKRLVEKNQGRLFD